MLSVQRRRFPREIRFDGARLRARDVESALLSRDPDREIIGEIDSMKDRFDRVIAAVVARENAQVQIELRLRSDSYCELTHADDSRAVLMSFMCRPSRAKYHMPMSVIGMKLSMWKPMAQLVACDADTP